MTSKVSDYLGSKTCSVNKIDLGTSGVVSTKIQKQFTNQQNNLEKHSQESIHSFNKVFVLFIVISNMKSSLTIVSAVAALMVVQLCPAPALILEPIIIAAWYVYSFTFSIYTLLESID